MTSIKLEINEPEKLFKPCITLFTILFYPLPYIIKFKVVAKFPYIYQITKHYVSHSFDSMFNTQTRI